MRPDTYIHGHPLVLPLELPLSDGLVLYLPLQGGSRKSVNNAVGYPLSGTLYGNASIVSAPTGWALDFDGSGDYAEFPDSPLLQPQAFTLSAWVKRRQIGVQQGIISRFVWDSYGYKLEFSASNNLNITIVRNPGGSGNTIQQASGMFVTDNNWHHCVGVWTGTQIFRALDGVFSTPTSVTSLKNDTNKKLYIGALITYLAFLNGQIANVRIYNRALALSEIRRLYEIEKM